MWYCASNCPWCPSRDFQQARLLGPTWSLQRLWREHNMYSSFDYSIDRNSTLSTNLYSTSKTNMSSFATILTLVFAAMIAYKILRENNTIRELSGIPTFSPNASTVSFATYYLYEMLLISVTASSANICWKRCSIHVRSQIRSTFESYHTDSLGTAEPSRAHPLSRFRPVPGSRIRS